MLITQVGTMPKTQCGYMTTFMICNHIWHTWLHDYIVNQDPLLLHVGHKYLIWLW